MSELPGTSLQTGEDGVLVLDLSEAGSASEARRAAHDPAVTAVVLVGADEHAQAAALFVVSGKPVVYALSGPVDHATLASACRCDARVAAHDTVVRTADLLSFGMVEVLADLIGAGRLPQLLLADELTAAQMYSCGLVGDLCSAADLQDRAVGQARRLARLGPDTLGVLRNRRMPGSPIPPTAPPDGGAVHPPAGQLRVVPDAGAESSTRQRILDAAAHVLRTRGYNACRLSDIAKLCGTHQTAVYHYFRSKEALVDEVLRVGVTRTAETVEAAVEGLAAGATALDRLATAIRAHLRMVLDSGDYAGATIRVPGELPAESQQRLRSVQHDYGQYWSRLFADAQAGGYLRPGIDLSVNRALVAGALNYALEWYDPAKGSVDELADELVPTFLAGLAAPERVRDLDLTRIGRTPVPDPEREGET